MSKDLGLIRKLNDKINNNGAYLEYVRNITLNLFDYFEASTAIKRQNILSDILNEENKHILDCRNKLFNIKNYLVSLNIYLIDDIESKNIEKIALEIDIIISTLEREFLFDFS